MMELIISLLNDIEGVILLIYLDVTNSLCRFTNFIMSIWRNETYTFCNFELVTFKKTVILLNLTILINIIK